MLEPSRSIFFGGRAPARRRRVSSIRTRSPFAYRSPSGLSMASTNLPRGLPRCRICFVIFGSDLGNGEFIRVEALHRPGGPRHQHPLPGACIGSRSTDAEKGVTRRALSSRNIGCAITIAAPKQNDSLELAEPGELPLCFLNVGNCVESAVDGQCVLEMAAGLVQVLQLHLDPSPHVHGMCLGPHVS